MRVDETASGRIFDIQRFCINDGPGIRTTVFLAGCHLHCPWCHNPESRPLMPRVSLQNGKCMSCGRCKSKPEFSGVCVREIDRACRGCSTCIKECPTGALTLLGREITVSEVMQLVLKDAVYYQATGGGLTISGGEPLLQHEFAINLLQTARARTINTAIETSGAVSEKIIRQVQPYCDCFLYDIKCSRSQYKEMVGADGENVIANLRVLSELGASIRLRVPLIAGYNVTEEFLDELRLWRQLPGVKAVDLLPFHELGRGKATGAGLPEADWSKMSAPAEEMVKLWQETLA